MQFVSVILFALLYDIDETNDDNDRGEDGVHGSDGFKGWITVIL